MNGENPICDNNYDLIVSSMTFQWFENPLDALRKLAQKGDVYFSALGEDNFKEWKAHVKHSELHDRTITPIVWPNILAEDMTKKNYECGLNFLKNLKETGASKSFASQHNYDYKKFKNTLSVFNGQVSWHIVYGFQPYDNTVISTT